MNLFEYKDFTVVVSPEAITLKPFEVLWKRDKTKHKKNVMMELSYIYHMCDVRSDFNDITVEELRHNDVVAAVGLESKWKPDAKVKTALEFYKQRSETILTKLLKRCEIAIETVGVHVASLDMNERDNNGKLINDVSKIVSSLEKIPKLVESHSNAKKAVEKELNDSKNARGSVAPGMFENGM